jgi:hypothetical protein
LGIEAPLRPRGRPKKTKKVECPLFLSLFLSQKPNSVRHAPAMNGMPPSSNGDSQLGPMPPSPVRGLLGVRAAVELETGRASHRSKLATTDSRSNPCAVQTCEPDERLGKHTTNSAVSWRFS